MKDLLNRLSTEFDDVDGWIRIVDADWVADDLRLNVSIKFGDELEPELWEVECGGVVEERLSSDGAEALTLKPDSPLLMPYTEPEVDLMFSENTLTPEFLLGAVFSCCVETMGKPEYISKFLNLRPTVHGIARSGYGLLGRFPEPVAKAILSSLGTQPIKLKALPRGVPKRWTGSEFVSYPKLNALVIGESYVIAESFSAIRA
ncbi:MAG: hypothetical protein HZC23_00915 [Rhodocyclales bacterium]|nr:hypothetical protein [Rhodocyclales bacterium]